MLHALLTPAALALDVGDTILGVHAKLQNALAPQICSDETFDLGGGATGRVVGFEAPESDVAWASAMVDETAGGELVAWNGPSIEAPHLYARLAAVDEAYEVEIDFRNRLDAGYEPSGVYEPPASRAAFSQAALRAEYDAAFFDDEARSWRDGVRAAAAADAPSPWAALLVEGRRQYGGDNTGAIGGPLALCVRFPRDDAGAKAAADACASAADRYLGWVRNPKRASWMRTRLIYDRDCLVRQYLARAQIARLTEMHGAGGGAMAAHAAGRLDMMGHNMMQESTGFGSKGDDGERD